MKHHGKQKKTILSIKAWSETIPPRETAGHLLQHRGGAGQPHGQHLQPGDQPGQAPAPHRGWAQDDRPAQVQV